MSPVDAAELWPAPARRRHWQELMDLLQPQAGEHILDVGCGRGHAVANLAGQVGLAGRSANLIAGSGLTQKDLDRWRADLAERAARGEYLYCIYLYACMGRK